MAKKKTKKNEKKLKKASGSYVENASTKKT